jgi:hypothetical protein
MSFHKNISGRGIHEPGQFQVKNSTGATITKGKVVKLTGFDIFPLIAVSTSPGVDVIFGVVTDDLEDGCQGYVARAGLFGRFNTSAFAVMDLLYANMTGDLTTVANGTKLGRVAKVDATDGHILFDIPSEGTPSSQSGHTLEQHTITNTDITNGYITLGNIPATPAQTYLSVSGMPGQDYGTDYTVAGSQLSWLSVNPGDLGNHIQSGDLLTVFIK